MKKALDAVGLPAGASVGHADARSGAAPDDRHRWKFAPALETYPPVGGRFYRCERCGMAGWVRDGLRELPRFGCSRGML